MAHVSDGDSESSPPGRTLDRGDRIIEILGIFGIDGDKRDGPMITAALDLFIGNRIGKSGRCGFHLGGKLLSQLVLSTDHLKICSPGSFRSQRTEDLARWQAVDGRALEQSRQHSISILDTGAMPGIDPDFTDALVAKRLDHSCPTMGFPVDPGDHTRATFDHFQDLATSALASDGGFPSARFLDPGQDSITVMGIAKTPGGNENITGRIIDQGSDKAKSLAHQGQGPDQPTFSVRNEPAAPRQRDHLSRLFQLVKEEFSQERLFGCSGANGCTELRDIYIPVVGSVTPYTKCSK